MANVGTLVLLVCLAAVEMKTSWIQAWVFSAAAARIRHSVGPGPSPAIRFPSVGPYNDRLGYSRLPVFVDRLEDAGYRIVAQARSSDMALRLAKLGIYPVYREKAHTGLTILDRDETPLFAAQFPGRIHETYEAIPPVVVETLLLIENREILNGSYPYRNPAIEWDRMAKAALDFGLHKVYSGHAMSGGSTLATQLEKVRHSPGGHTGSVLEKARQITSASLRSYLDGRVTIGTRERIVRDYINSIPLAALPGYGEVSGLGDGLWAWFGADFESVNRLLSGGARPAASDPLLAERAQGFRQVLSLLLALNQPTYFLRENRPALNARTDGYLRLLAEAGTISPALRDAALHTELAFRDRAPAPDPVSFSERKAVDAIRAGLLSSLGVNSVYDLDRLDLTVRASLDGLVQREVTNMLRQLSDPAQAAAAGLAGERLLNGAEPGSVIYSFTLYERAGGANLLRVQADNLDQPLNINQGTKLELGSTAKLRTLVNYLEIVARLHGQYSALTPEQLSAVRVDPSDRLSRWAVEYLAASEDRSLPAMLEAAMNRSYSASPAEGFFTGGGLHYFENFDRDDNARVLTVREAFQRSVNLVFIRLMRDLVHYYASHGGVSLEALQDRKHPLRQEYLRRFADQEGRMFLARFHQKYSGLSQDEALETLIGDIRPAPKRLAVIYRSVRPEASLGEFALFLAAHTRGAGLPWKTVEKLYEEYARERFGWSDRGWRAGVHPLELWLLEYKGRHPEADWRQVVEASAAERRAAYEWLYRLPYGPAQEWRIRTVLETEAFRRMHKDWQRLGFLFDSLVPSYATAIGSSGDNPAALAELAGIILNGGVRYPSLRVNELRFAAGTPFETVLERSPAKGARVLDPTVAAVVKQEMLGVVEHGTARRAWRAFLREDGSMVPVGGKTGTGDNRFETHVSGGRPTGWRVVNRTATFVFTIGDRWFGAITAYVPGEQAASYEFTSSLPVQIFKQIAPLLKPLVAG